MVCKFQALSSIKDILVHHVILDPTSGSGFDTQTTRSNLSSIPFPLSESLNSSFNSSQFQAICAAIGTSNLSLVQGPPGAEETYTIVVLDEDAIIIDEADQAFNIDPSAVVRKPKIATNVAFLNACIWLHSLC
ncbi:unnamed protein product [Arabis nemorensis]|uniref:Uncharacterized protein n=1 Tax=Arabis nemorensis TaxID=586526 RepID=A0A565C2I2_9BRAS|nr:unnamed protein product [Arabis nemorensis]